MTSGVSRRVQWLQREAAQLERNAFFDADIGARLGLAKTLSAVGNTRNVRKADMIHNDLQPLVTVDPETYQVHADGQLLWCEPATNLPMAQRYFLF